MICGLEVVVVYALYGRTRNAASFSAEYYIIVITLFVRKNCLEISMHCCCCHYPALTT